MNYDSIKGYLEPILFAQRINSKKNFKLLALDLGKKKIGMAICNTEIRVSIPTDVFFRKNINYDINHISHIIKEKEVEGLIVGIPVVRHEQQNKNPMEHEYIIQFIEKLSPLIPGISITFQDESFSTKAADELLRAAGIKRIKRNSVDDAVAASIILNSFLKQFIF